MGKSCGADQFHALLGGNVADVIAAAGLTNKLQIALDLRPFGFGTDAMKTTTVCTNCNSMESSKNLFCSKCGERLPRANLYDYYRMQHSDCSHCKAVVSESMEYCPKCGKKIKK